MYSRISIYKIQQLNVVLFIFVVVVVLSLWVWDHTRPLTRPWGEQSHLLYSSLGQFLSGASMSRGWASYTSVGRSVQMAKFSRDPVLRGITRNPCPGLRVKTSTSGGTSRELRYPGKMHHCQPRAFCQECTTEEEDAALRSFYTRYPFQYFM